MNVLVRLGGPRARRWHVDLAATLGETLGCSVALLPAGGHDDPAYRALDRLAGLERLLHSASAPGLALAADARVVNAAPRRRADFVLDLRDDPLDGWTVRFDDRPGVLAAAAALRAGRFPTVTVLTPDGDVAVAGRPGSERPGLVGAALSDVLAGTTTLLVGALTGHEFCPPVADASPEGQPPSFSRVAGRRIISAAAQRAYRLVSRAPHWRTGWRRMNGQDVVELGDHPESGWTDLPDDGYHFYADPFLLERDGRTYLFVEDFDHRTAKAVVSVVELDEAGPVGTPEAVLTHDVHLSYPFVLEHDDEVWMVPETSGAGTVELYRAVAFPWVWEREAVLLDGLVASDATLFRHDGRWWMTATVRHGGSFSDTLHLWSANDLRGPWKPHARNPVLVDIASARPAGAVVVRDGRLLRPVQDGRDGYGAALNLMEITRLDDEAFEQRLVGRLEPSDRWPGRRVHTLNSAGGFEVIDGSRLALRGNRVRRWGARGSAREPLPDASANTLATVQEGDRA